MKGIENVPGQFKYSVKNIGAVINRIINVPGRSQKNYNNLNLYLLCDFSFLQTPKTENTFLVFLAADHVNNWRSLLT